MKAMVLAAGLGTRFRPVTDSLPKPLVPLCNRPLVGWAIDALIAGGVSEVVVNLHHHPDPLRRWLDAEYEGRCGVHYSFEPEILGTGGGLRRAKEHFAGEDLFFLVNGDSVQFPPFGALSAAMRTTGAVAAMLLRHPPSDDRFTSVWFDGTRVTAIGETGRGESLMFSGVHALTPEVFEQLPDRAFSGMTEDFYLPMLAKGESAVAGVVDDGLWFDVGSPMRYLQASRELTAAIVRGEVAMPRGSQVVADGSIADESARLEGEFSKSVAAAGVAFAGDASVVESALWKNVTVGAGARIESSIVGAGVEIPSGARVTNALLWNDRRGLLVVAIDPRHPAVSAGM